MPDLRFSCFSTDYVVVECIDCGHRFLNPRPREDALSSFYPAAYFEGRGSDDPRQMRRYLKQAEIVEELAKPGRLLDVGCAGGGWLAVMQDRGWSCVGADIVDSSSREEGVEIRVGSLPDLEFDLESFDLITAWGAMVHVSAPSQYFAAIHDLLRDHGYFVFMVPNGDSWWSRWAYKEDVPRHLHFFRRKTLNRYAGQFGFELAHIQYRNDVYSLPASGRGLFRRRLLRLTGVGWEDINGRPSSVFQRSAGKIGDLADTCLIHPKVEERLGKSGNMIVIFRKKEDASRRDRG